MSGRAGVLLATTVRMVEAASLLALVRATRSDAVVLVLTFAVLALRAVARRPVRRQLLRHPPVGAVAGRGGH